MEKTLDELFIRMYYDQQGDNKKLVEKYNLLLDTIQELLSEFNTIDAAVTDQPGGMTDPLNPKTVKLILQTNKTVDKDLANDQVVARYLTNYKDRLNDQINQIKNLKRL